jgi:hypothetical protein
MKKGVCKNGHRLTPKNSVTFARKLIGPDGEVTFMDKRTCRRCRIKYMARRRREAGIPKYRRRTRCPSGHPYSPENTITVTGRYHGVRGDTIKSFRRCRKCVAQKDSLYWERQRERRQEARAA